MKLKSLHLFFIVICLSLTGAVTSCSTSKKASGKSHESAAVQNGRRKVHHDRKISKEKKKIVEEAYGWLGTPYAYGRNDKGKACDCSGMVMTVFEKVTGVKLPRNSAKQQEFCRNLKKKDVETGDLCFFATGKDPDRTSHVGIMIDDTNFIHASTSKGVVISDITQPYWVRTFKGFGRVPVND